MPNKSIRNAWFGTLFFVAMTASSEAGVLPGDYQPVLAVAPQEPAPDDRISVTAHYWFDWFALHWYPATVIVKNNANRITIELSSVGAQVVATPPPPHASYSTIWLDPLPEGSYQLDVVLKGYLYDGTSEQDFAYPSHPFTVSLKNDTTAVVEYYNTGLQHYFMTAGAGEMASIEAGAAGPGWQLTGSEFRAYLPETGVQVGALPVSRFYGTPGRGPNSHFYTVDATESEIVKQDPGWTYEGVAFYLFAPVNGQCATDQQAIYRVYNNRFAQNDSNHRYITDPNLYAQMQAQGWLPEGVVLCGAAQN